MKTIATIVARGGSKRLPRKNVRPFCGHPLVAWAIVQAKCAHEIDWVYLSTDDDEIAEIGRQYGAEVIRRPDWPDADQVAANRPFVHVLDTLLESGDITLYDDVVHILPTSPLVKPGDIDSLVREHRRIGADHSGMFVKLREAIAYKVIHPVKVRNDLIAKHYQYATLGPAINVQSVGWYLAINAGLASDHDAALDSIYLTNDWIREAFVGLWCDQWQSQEVDVLAEFELAEVLMEHYILQGRGIDTYYDYMGRPYEY